MYLPTVQKEGRELPSAVGEYDCTSFQIWIPHLWFNLTDPDWKMVVCSRRYIVRLEAVVRFKTQALPGGSFGKESFECHNGINCRAVNHVFDCHLFLSNTSIRDILSCRVFELAP